MMCCAQVLFVVDVLENGEFRFAGWNLAAEQATGISTSRLLVRLLKNCKVLL